jgi:hypothetical protein
MIDLERGLRDLGAGLDYPAMPALDRRVTARLREPASARLGPSLRSPWRVRRVVALAAAALVLAAGTAMAVRFWVRGIEVRPVPQPPAASFVPVGQGLDLGRPTTLLEARVAAGFPVGVPAALGPPDQVWLRGDLGFNQVTLLYRPRPGLPESPATGVGLLLTQLTARIEAPSVVKGVGPGTTLQPVQVDGNPGFWIEGTPHSVLYVDPGGRTFPDTVRLAGNVLAWEVGEVTLRLEAEVSRARALDIARSVE